MTVVPNVKGKKIFGERIKPLREKVGLNQARFAEEAGIAVGTMSRYEGDGVQTVSLESLRRMCDAMNRQGAGLKFSDFLAGIAAPDDAPTVEWTTVRLPRSLIHDLRTLARASRVPLEDYLAAVVNSRFTPEEESPMAELSSGRPTKAKRKTRGDGRK